MARLSSIVFSFFLCFIGYIGNSRPFRVAFVGDPQVDDSRELWYARKTIYSELRSRKDLDLVILLGDLVNDDVSLLVPTKATLDSLSCPWLSVPGNHDRDFYGKKKGQVISFDRTVDEVKPRDFASFARIVGPLDTTFIAGGVRFVLLNDIVEDGRLGYYGGLSKSQKVYVDSVLRATPSDMLAVLSAHIPFSEFAKKDSLSSLFVLHPKLLLMCAHTHYAARSYILRGIPEVKVGAACGSFWRGQKNGNGIPKATMNCGSPRGYYIVDFYSGGKYSLEYKVCEEPDRLRASAWLTKNNRLIVNVFGGAVDGLVTVKLPGVRNWIKLERTDEIAPEVLLERLHNKLIRRTHGNFKDFIPLRAKPSPHIWSRTIEGDAISKLPKEIKVKIKYYDNNMSFKTETIVRDLDI